ncbi:MAG: type III-A CRISPR-associated protein Cas10/Csm1 [Deltaproteobacteria bacterium]|jgi:CRISPR-associated protein Csm1|nr:type III-A CRISPR-associated protein Cas10/Csm1 [Deltaproteobacteria bacterium]
MSIFGKNSPKKKYIEASELALGALTHDLGKFLERTQPAGQGLSQLSQNLQSSVCPLFKGHYSRNHVLYTNEFFLINHFWPPELDSDRIANLAIYHHFSTNEEQQLISEADRLSSGHERRGEELSARTRLTKLLSPLSTVFLDSPDDWKSKGRLPLAPFSMDSAFPLTDSQEEILCPQYKALWEQFLVAWQANNCSKPLDFVNRALAILEHFTWCIPSAVNARPDISLFDHLKTTAALALAKAWSEDADRPYLLLVGSLNGIQKHIFKVKAGQGGLAKRMRARSFQVAVYAESVMLEILGQLSLPLTQCLTLAGGKFQLLLPNSQETKEVIESVLLMTSDWLYQQSGAELSINLANKTATDEEIKKEFPQLADEALELLRQERNREGSPIVQTQDGWSEERFVLANLMPEAGQGLCPGCGQRPEADGDLCPSCQDEKKLGTELTKAERVIFFREKSPSPDKYSTPVGTFSLLKEKSTPAEVNLVASLGPYCPQFAPKQPLVSRPRARHVPLEDGQPMEFSQLAQKALGQPALGYLKLDVDRLGYAFSDGFGEDRSISRTAALSRSLEAFFSLQVEDLCKKYSVYIVYSGGDDVAAIGPWDQIFELALTLREKFLTYCDNNPRLTLSAGVAIAPPKLPVTAGLEEAEKLLSISKNIPGPGVLPWAYVSTASDETTTSATKDRISAFSVSLPWAKFSSTMCDAKQLSDWLSKGFVSTGQVRRLLNYAQMYQNYHITRKTHFFEYAPLLARDVSRNWTVKHNDAPEKSQARDWAASLALPHSSKMAELGFVCRYALTANRHFEERQQNN